MTYLAVLPSKQGSQLPFCMGAEASATDWHTPSLRLTGSVSAHAQSSGIPGPALPWCAWLSHPRWSLQTNRGHGPLRVLGHPWLPCLCSDGSQVRVLSERKHTCMWPCTVAPLSRSHLGWVSRLSYCLCPTPPRSAGASSLVAAPRPWRCWLWRSKGDTLPLHPEQRVHQASGSSCPAARCWVGWGTGASTSSSASGVQCLCCIS